MADNCALAKISGRFNLPYKAFPFPEIVPSAPVTMGIIVIITIIIIIIIMIIYIIGDELLLNFGTKFQL